MRDVSSFAKFSFFLVKVVSFVTTQILLFNGLLTITLSSVSVAAFMSWVLAAVVTTDNGTPFLSLIT
jgi:hypothetical protein